MLCKLVSPEFGQKPIIIYQKPEQMTWFWAEEVKQSGSHGHTQNWGRTPYKGLEWRPEAKFIQSTLIWGSPGLAVGPTYWASVDEVICLVNLDNKWHSSMLTDSQVVGMPKFLEGQMVFSHQILCKKVFVIFLDTQGCIPILFLYTFPLTNNIQWRDLWSRQMQKVRK